MVTAPQGSENIGIRPTGVTYLKFLAAAGASVPFNLGSRILFSLVVPFALAIILSQIVGVLVAYTLSRAFVFTSSRKSRLGELARFALVNVFSLTQIWIVSVVTLYWIIPFVGYHYFEELSAHLVGLGSTSITSFFAHRAFTFREVVHKQEPIGEPEQR